ncbi:MAG: hypothetical protein U0531_03135 [Dehalococcoidia bacterium]
MFCETPGHQAERRAGGGPNQHRLAPASVGELPPNEGGDRTDDTGDEADNAGPEGSLTGSVEAERLDIEGEEGEDEVESEDADEAGNENAGQIPLPLLSQHDHLDRPARRTWAAPAGSVVAGHLPVGNRCPGRGHGKGTGTATTATAILKQEAAVPVGDERNGQASAIWPWEVRR